MATKFFGLGGIKCKNRWYIYNLKDLAHALHVEINTPYNKNFIFLLFVCIYFGNIIKKCVRRETIGGLVCRLLSISVIILCESYNR